MTAGEHALIVLAHPRPDSLTAQLAHHVRDRLGQAGFSVDVLDLHAEGFDPRMQPVDEPDWADRDKVYSPEVQAHFRRLDSAGMIVVVFPVWWFGLPAVLKGWVDRVWNYGLAYGRAESRLHGKRMLWLGLVSYTQEQFAERGWDEPVARLLREGISEFCGITHASAHFIYDSLNAGEAAFTSADLALRAFA
ncbi:NAD(P)H oxidoreductase [Microtetraspora niveoalba]|uniref:NAD(P)H oxidoreductase n=1 Tax=Microtetraspora niveoalba TaxID=46175 RepID=UPI0008351E34|nr:NAD(P)H oxidoreductase [Microtetraspora niveoalba]